MGGYAVLAAGLGLFAAPHLLKRLAPDWRARQGDWVKGVVTILLIASLWVISRGYQAIDASPMLWPRVGALVWVNNILNMAALFLFAASNTGGWVASRLRHPQLTAVKVWAVAHLLVNGTVAALALFGALLAWAVVEVIVINRQAAGWAPKAPGPLWRDGLALAVAVIAWGGITWLHTRSGLWPYPWAP